MNYIGSKLKLIDFVKKTIYNVVGMNLSQKVFCDLFAGTGIVGRAFKAEVKKVISNDIEYYSYVLNRNYIGNTAPIPKQRKHIDELNQLSPVKGFIYKNYCIGGGSGRQYFSDLNGGKIDAIRQEIRQLLAARKINTDTHYFLLASLLESADKVANTASVYGAYLKHLKKSAAKELCLESADFEITKNKHSVFNDDSSELIKKIDGDILYLDPPYNERQYGANYHILNTIARSDTFTPSGKTGLREYAKSVWCCAGKVQEAFEDLLKNANFKYVFLSYNNEGLMPISAVRQIMSKFGDYSVVSVDYQRFKADRDSNRAHKATTTKEYIHILVKR